MTALRWLWCKLRGHSWRPWVRRFEAFESRSCRRCPQQEWR